MNQIDRLQTLLTLWRWLHSAGQINRRLKDPATDLAVVTEYDRVGPTWGI